MSDNELIAEFMGGQISMTYRNLTTLKNASDLQEAKKHGWEANLHYDTSWDCLMPVVEKIENISHIGIDAVYFQIRGKTCHIWTYFDAKEFLRLTGDDKNDGNKFKVGHTAKTKIQAVYHAVIDFIKWYKHD